MLCTQSCNKALIRTFGRGFRCQFCRGSSAYARCDDKDTRFFEGILGSENVKTNELDAFNIDFMRHYKGASQCVLFPETESQTSEILRFCHDRRLAVVPQGGNTGLAGGSVPCYDEIIVSTRRLASHFRIDPFSRILHCDAGFILEDLDNRLVELDLAMPLDLASRGSCLIGGNVATNAGGIRQIRFGSLHANVLGIRVVIPDNKGTVLNLGCGLQKDNSDIHLKNIFIGSEGQFGIITHVSMLATDRLKHAQSLFLAVDSYRNCYELLRLARSRLGRDISAFEFMDAETVECVIQNTRIRGIFEDPAPFYLLIETASSDSNDCAKVDNFLTHCFENGMLLDGALASKEEEAENFWRLRDEASVALLKDGYVYKFDLSLPLEHFYDIVEIVRRRLMERVPHLIRHCVGFGHLGDGNLHLNIVAEQNDPSVRNILYPFVYEWVVQNGGSISAEHGIGQMRRDFHHNIASRKRLQINENIKSIFDPQKIMSPYKLI